MNYKEINIKLPVNLRQDELSLFPQTSYTLEEPTVLTYSNVLATKPGICIKGFNLLSASTHDYKHLWRALFKIAIGNILLRKKKKLPPGNYLLIHNIWCRGYYHWICEALPRLWLVKDKVAEHTLLLPEWAKGGLAETLKPFKFRDILYFPPSSSFLVPSLTLPANPKRVYEPDPNRCAEIRGFYLSQLDREWARKFDFGERIYVSRRKAKSRKVSNEEQLEEILQEFGFKVICFEDYSFFEQVAIMYHVRYLVSIHGAGLTNMHFMKAGGSVLEFYKERVPGIDYGRVRRTDLPSPCYPRLASALQHKHYILFCKATDPAIPSGKANIFVEPFAFEKVIQGMLEG